MHEDKMPIETVSSDSSSATSMSEGAEKRPYHSPNFVEFGQVTELTQGSALTLSDGGAGSTISVTIP
jgi:hypothetical protein